MAYADSDLKPQTTRLAALKSLKRALILVWDADSKSTLAIAFLTLINGLLPVAQAWVAKLIIDGVTHSISATEPPVQAFRGVLPYLYLEFVLIFFGAIAGQFRRLLDEILDHKLGFSINSAIIRKALKLELHYFENAEFYDKMQNARRQSEYKAMAILNSSLQVVQSTITLFSFLAFLIAASPWIAFLLFGATLPAFVAQTRYSKLNFRLQTWKAPETRKMGYYEHLLTVDSSAKEVQLFGLGEPLLSRYAEIFWKVFHEDTRLAWKRSWVSLGWGLLSTISYYLCYAWIVFRTIGGVFTLGTMTLYIAIFRQSQSNFAGVFDSLARLYENSLFMENLFSFLDLPEVRKRSRSSNLPGLDPSRGIEVKGLSFRYAQEKAWALKNIDLIIPPGQKVALVGENGSGKTTFIKLLTRLYDPTEGEIHFQGRDLRDWDLEELRRKIGVIFQDFVRYQLTVRENVGFGAIEDIENQNRVENASVKGGMEEVLSSLEEGWDTTLGGWFQKGRELSGGQWQRIALSRAFMRDGDVIVLDEPTSALDAQKEYEIFQKFKNLTAGKTAILISHRFSTVRMADQIVVLKSGSIEEVGSHQELVLRQGTYSKLFELQAEGYR